MKKLRRLSSVASATSLGTLLAIGLAGCLGEDNPQSQQQTQSRGAFVIIEETAPGQYKIKEEFPSDETRIVLKQLDGIERVLTQEEMNRLLREEEAKIENGTSRLTDPNGAQMTSGGMSIGEAILASAAGAIIGSWIGSKLFGNSNYQNNRQAGYKSPSTYTRSQKSFNQPRKSTSTKSSGFFSNKSGSSYKSSFGG
jgi:hypothetical protein